MARGSGGAGEGGSGDGGLVPEVPSPLPLVPFLPYFFGNALGGTFHASDGWQRLTKPSPPPIPLPHTHSLALSIREARHSFPSPPSSRFAFSASAPPIFPVCASSPLCPRAASFSQRPRAADLPLPPPCTTGLHPEVLRVGVAAAMVGRRGGARHDGPGSGGEEVRVCWIRPRWPWISGERGGGSVSRPCSPRFHAAPPAQPVVCFPIPCITGRHHRRIHRDADGGATPWWGPDLAEKAKRGGGGR